MRKFSEADGGTPTGEAKDRVGLVAGTTYYAKYWNDNFFNIFNFVENAGYTLINDNLEQLTKALKGRYVDSYTYNTSAIATQTVDDIVQGSDGLYYEVQADAVSGDDPVGSVTGNWLEVAFDKENAKQWDKQTTTHNFTTDANYTLTAAQNKFGRIVLTDTNPFLTVARNIIVSDKIRDILVYNATLQALTIKTLAGSGIAVAAGAKVWLLCDGTNVIESIDVGTTVELPSITGSATFTNATNNINLTDIGALSGLEVGDVFQISGSTNNDTEFTVEVITDANNVIVNQAHAGGTTTKSLINETATVTIKLLAKWYEAPIGLGQGWVDVTSSRAVSTPYPNDTKRSIEINVISGSASPTSGLGIYIDNIVASAEYVVDANNQVSIHSTVQPDSSYSASAYVSGTVRTLITWTEKR